MQVRSLNVQDAAAYRALMLQAYERAPDAFMSTAAERASAPMGWWEERVADPRGLSQAFGAFADGVLIGAVAVEYSARVKTRHKAALVGMYVTPEHRARGAGRALLDVRRCATRMPAGM